MGCHLKSGYAFRNLICSPLPNQVPKMITLLHPWQSHRSYHFENFGFTCNTSLPLVKISGSKWPTEKAGRAAGRDSQIVACQLARCRSAEGAALCPSDMMLCVISYWVLSGAKRRQIQQLRCCVFPRQAVETEECLSEINTTQRTSRSTRHLQPKAQ